MSDKSFYINEFKKKKLINWIERIVYRFNSVNIYGI